MKVESPLFFETPAHFRAWLRKHHRTATEQWVGFYKKGSGKPSITWPESVDQALCFGWIDGVRRSLDADSYVIRFTPRSRKSHWSAVNIRRAQELIATGEMQPAGLAAFEARDEANSRRASYERESANLSAAQEAAFRKNRAAWRFWQAQPPGYRKTASWWVISAKRAETQARRLQTLIDDSAHGRRIAMLQRPGTK